MAKIAIIGAGGYVFPFRLIGDLLSFPALREQRRSRLMDIDADRLERTAGAARELVAHHGFPTAVETTTDRAARARRRRLRDHHLPGRRRRCLPRTTSRSRAGTGSTRRSATPSAPAASSASCARLRPTASIAADIARALPGRAADQLRQPDGDGDLVPRPRSGLRAGRPLPQRPGHHPDARPRSSTSRTTRCAICAAGINHQAWFLEFRRGDEDLYPRLREVMRTPPHLAGRTTGLADDDGDHSGADRGASTYEGGSERVRTALMDAFGYFHTESSHHASEYLPVLPQEPRAGARLHAGALGLLRDLPRPRRGRAASTSSWPAQGRARSRRSSTAPSSSTPWRPDRPTRDLRQRAEPRADREPARRAAASRCPAWSTRNGVQPTAVGALPPQCAALNRTNINVQELAVQAALTGNREHVYHAVMLDPLTGALLTLEQIRAMIDELFAARRTPPSQRIAVTDGVSLRSRKQSGCGERASTTTSASRRTRQLSKQPSRPRRPSRPGPDRGGRPLLRRRDPQASCSASASPTATPRPRIRPSPGQSRHTAGHCRPGRGRPDPVRLRELPVAAQPELRRAHHPGSRGLRRPRHAAPHRARIRLDHRPVLPRPGRRKSAHPVRREALPRRDLGLPGHRNDRREPTTGLAGPASHLGLLCATLSVSRTRAGPPNRRMILPTATTRSGASSPNDPRPSEIQWRGVPGCPWIPGLQDREDAIVGLRGDRLRLGLFEDVSDLNWRSGGR